MTWHCREAVEVVEELGSTAQGLSASEAGKRLNQWGPNELVEKKKKTPFMMFLEQFKDFMILILIAAAVISGLIGEVLDTVAIVVIIVLNAVIGFVQEYRAEKAIATLKKMAAPFAVVIRDGASTTVPAAELVPGDIVVVEAGNVIPADMRFIESAHLKVEEAALTGESVPVEKHTAALPDASAPLGDRRNMAYKGTVAVYGRGTAVVVTTGMETELGKIATMLQEEQEVKTPLQKRLTAFGKILSFLVLAICAIIFGIGILRGEPPMLMLLTAISLAVAAIPEALPAVVTISLALGAKKLVRQNALIRKLPAVETLGSVTYICSDKTGTLTVNRMTVEEFYVDGHIVKGAAAGRNGGFDTELKPYELLMLGLAVNNDVREDTSGAVIGDPTEAAAFSFAKKAGYFKKDIEVQLPRVAEIPFDSERKCMTTLHRWSGQSRFISFTKGAPDILLEKSIDILTSEGLKKIDSGEITRINELMASEGLRVLAVGMRFLEEMPPEFTPGAAENELTLLGLVGMMDPPRQEAKDAIELCLSAGITPVIVTGDHPVTARSIAKRLGIVGDYKRAILTGRELERLSIEALEQRVEHIRVYARVAPEQKLKIVKALQDKGQFVAMTGDGVNDAPALKRADIGVAMGITGTDVSKEASHMILLDDNFATIVKSIKEGRRIFDNVRKFIKYTMTSNSGEIWSIFLAPFLGLPIPLLPIHILWINLATDGLPGLALSAEPPEKGIMNRPPRPPKESIFAHGLAAHILWVGLLMGFTTIFTQAWAISTGTSHWQTMAFTVLCLSQMGNVLAVRSERESIFRQGLFSNKPLLGAFVLTFVLQMAIIYVPVLQRVFRTEALTLNELAFTLAMSSVVFIALEIEKFFRRRFAKEKG